jgi:hypothetical protein
MFEVRNKNTQERVKIGDSGYMEEFWHEDFVFIILFYLFIYF